MRPAALVALAVLAALALLLYYSAELASRGEYGAEFVWTASGLVVLGISSLFLVNAATAKA